MASLEQVYEGALGGYRAPRGIQQFRPLCPNESL